MFVGVLGPLRVERDDTVVVDLPRRMERRLVTALAANHPQTVTVDGLLEALWGEKPPATARKTLQTNVLRLRKVLGSGAIVTAPDGYRLGSNVCVDVDEFEQTGALRWWRGEPFADLPDWPALAGRRTRLVELRRCAEDAAAESRLHGGRASDAVAELERLVLEDGARERRWTLLVCALVAADRRPEALRAYERARRMLAAELGISPGAELDAAHRAALDGGRWDDAGPIAHEDPRCTVDRLLATGSSLAADGNSRAATAAYVHAAGVAREAGDVRRFAEAALGAAGDGMRVSLDATEEVLLLVREALARVPPGPTPTRARLLARVSVLQSQHLTAADNERPARTALGIARALDDPALIAGALAAITIAVADPLRRDERVAWIDELLALAHSRPSAPWLRWAQPLDARERVLAGDIAGALAVFTDLDAATAGSDVVGHHAASYGHVLAATVAGDWDRARVAAARARRTASEAMFDDGTAIIAERGTLNVIALLEGVAPPAPFVDIEWPTPEMDAAVSTNRAYNLASNGFLAEADVILRRICPLVPELARDGYWLSTVSMLASATSLTANQSAAEVVADLLAPCVELTVTDPGLVYRGSGAHFAGLASAVLGRPDADELLRYGLKLHQHHGSTWMAQRSSSALQSSH